jgi:predicted DCC family thiol-disulfide oxidoreductase YuxK
VEPAIIVYDSDCGFCRWALARILAWDRRQRLRPVALQDDAAVQLLPDMAAEERARSWHLVTPGEGVRSGGAALPPLLRLLPGGAWVGAVAAAFPRSTERLYRWTADHRDLLGRLVGAKACSVDPREVRPGDRRSA